MCEFCLKHGEGQKWYLRAKNYSEDLLSDIHRRAYMKHFFSDYAGMERSKRIIDGLEMVPRFIKRIFGRAVSRKAKINHFGQVVPLEEAEKILGFVNSVVRVACLCRHVNFGEEKRYCYGLSMGANGGRIAEIFRKIGKSFLAGADNAGLETLTKEEALAAIREHEREGLCHTIWTFQTPFIAGLCNCDTAGCLAMRLGVRHSIPIMFPAEYIAEVDKEKCTGCGRCLKACQFQALRQKRASAAVEIDQRKCYGCGVCRSFCPQGALRIKDRTR